MNLNTTKKHLRSFAVMHMDVRMPQAHEAHDCMDGQRCSNIALAFPTSMWVTGGRATHGAVAEERRICVFFS